MELTVIIPVYNVAPYLEQCLDSVLADNGFTGQVICVDDGSTDGSSEILEKYKDRYLNVEVYSQSNQGQAVARNLGLNHALGDYVLFLDSDDYFLPNAIATVSELIASNPRVDYIYTDCAVTIQDERFYTLPMQNPVCRPLREYYDYEYEQFKSTPRGCVWGGVIKRDFIEKNHLRMLPGVRYEDELFVFQTFLQEGVCVAAHLDEPYYFYRLGREGATTSRYTLQHFYDRRTVVRGCYDAMKEAGLATEARKNKIFGLAEENLLTAYQNGFGRRIKGFFNAEDLRIMYDCAVAPRQIKLCKLAAISPRLFAAYRTESLPGIVRRFINRYL